MRLAIIATPLPSPGMRTPPGAIDGDVLRARLPRSDTAFHVVGVDPTIDLAEQLDGLLAARRLGSGDEVLFYVSSPVAVSVDNEFFLCLDPANPNTGDALADVVAVFQDHVPGPILFVLECRHALAPQDPFRSATVVGAAKEAVNPARSGIELLIAARPMDQLGEGRPSSFTDALVHALDESDAQFGLLARTLTLFAAPMRASQPDHVLQFGGSDTTARPQPLLVSAPASVAPPEFTLLESSPALLPETPPARLSTHSPPPRGGQLLCVRSTVLLI